MRPLPLIGREGILLILLLDSVQMIVSSMLLKAVDACPNVTSSSEFIRRKGYGSS